MASAQEQWLQIAGECSVDFIFFLAGTKGGAWVSKGRWVTGCVIQGAAVTTHRFKDLSYELGAEEVSEVRMIPRLRKNRVLSPSL